MKEDPLERIAREEKQKGNKNLKTAIIVLAILCVALAGVLGYMKYKEAQIAKSLNVENASKESFYKLVEQLNVEKEDLIHQMEDLQADYANLSSDYDKINSQLDTSRAEIAQLIERMKSTQATDRAKIRQYEKELGTLRTIMRGYITQIDSLNTLNHKLTAEAASARKEAAQRKKENEELTQQVQGLSEQVAAGSVIKARGLNTIAMNKSGKATDKSKNAFRLVTTLSLLENDLAPKGPLTIYIRVKDPDGIIVTNSVQTFFKLNGEQVVASASREVDYEGKEVDLTIYLNDVPEFFKGIYTVEAYSDQGILGKCDLLLR